MSDRIFRLRMEYDELERNIRWFIRIRFLAITFGMILILLLKYISGVQFLTLPTWLLAVSGTLINLSYIRWLKRRLHLNTLAYFQFIIDIFIITAGIYYTEGIDSPFWVGYMMIIIATSVLISFRMSIFMVVASSLAYSSLIVLSYFDILPIIQVYIDNEIDIPKRHMQLDYLLPITFTRISFLFAASGLSGYLANIVKWKTNELKSVNSALVELKNYTEDIVESIDAGIIVVNTDFRITIWNSAMERLSQISRNEVLGKYYFQNFPHLRQAGFEKIISDVMETAQPYETLGREHFTSKRGTLIINRRIQPLRDSDNRVTGAIIITEDISEKRKLEKEIVDYNQKLNHQVEMLEKANNDLRRAQEQLLHSEKLAALGQMSAMLAHEIRNPLSAIGGYARAISAKLDSENPCKSYADTVVAETDKLENFLKERLDFISPMEGVMEPFIVQEVVEGAIVAVKNQVDANKISLKTEFEDGLPHMAINAPQLVHALIQILNNAIKAMPEGGNLEISLHSHRQNLDDLNSNWVVIKISDSGPGIPEDISDRIFEPFFSTDRMSLGLGLTVARKIIELHQGKISVESQVGSGTTFAIYLPIR